MEKESKHVVAFRKRHLKSSEAIIAWADGYIGEMMGKGDKTQHNGSLIVTDSRVAFYRKGFIGEIIEAIPLDKLTSVERRSTMGLRVIRLHTSHDDIEFKSFANKEAEAALNDAIEIGRSGSAGVHEHAGSDVYSQIKKLAELKEIGAITDDEFNDKKSKLMAMI